MTKIQRKLLGGPWKTVATLPITLSAAERQAILCSLRPGHRIVEGK